MIYIIYNPISGNKGNSYRAKIEEQLQNIPNSKIFKTAYANHAEELTKSIVAENPEKIIVIGGDGTINEVAKQLIAKEIPLGIIPMGSGNGLARHLGISLDFHKSLALAINSLNYQTIDVAFFNEKPFFCTAGIGFDAEVANNFSKRKGRGLLNYIFASLAVNCYYKNIEVKFENQEYYSTYFSITFANANQFGNNAFISPGSNLMDNKFELVTVKPLNILEKVKLGISLFLKSIHKHQKVTITSISSCSLQVNNANYYHLDGETFSLTKNSVNIKIVPKSLKIIF